MSTNIYVLFQASDPPCATKLKLQTVTVARLKFGLHLVKSLQQRPYTPEPPKRQLRPGSKPS